MAGAHEPISVSCRGLFMIAEGAGHFRQPGFVERLARRFSTLPMSPAFRLRLKRLYIAALTLQSGGRGLSASLPDGEVVRVLPEYAYLSWNPDEYRSFRDVVRAGMTALDIGANAGAYSLLLGQWVGRAGAVYAFEPSPRIFDGLVRHIELNDLAGVVHPVRAAVGRMSATAPLVVAGTHGESRLAGASDTGLPTIDVAVTTIDEFCAQHQITPTFIKIDVEGAELDVLFGARATIRRSRPDLLLFVEMHPSVWPLVGVSRQDIMAELATQSLEALPLASTPDIWALEGVCVRLVPR
jgi:FkbM family methyltransferase